MDQKLKFSSVKSSLSLKEFNTVRILESNSQHKRLIVKKVNGETLYTMMVLKKSKLNNFSSKNIIVEKRN